MTIRDFDDFKRRLWNWSLLDGCFGSTKISPTDIDGCVERNGQILILEGKGPNGDLSWAQQQLFKALQQTGVCTIFVAWGAEIPGSIYVYRLLTMRPDGTTETRHADTETFRAEVAKWFAQADRHHRRI
jgi:hypothetical protein